MKTSLQLRNKDWHCTFGLRAVGLSFYLFARFALCVHVILRFQLGSNFKVVKWIWFVLNNV
jgi:hypothetical protein